VKILQVHNHYRQAGGEDTVAANEAELLRGAGHEVIEYRQQNPFALLPSAAQMTVAAWNPMSAAELRNLQEEHRPDITHVHNTWFRLSPSVFQALGSNGTPVVMTLHNYRLVCANAMLLRDGKPCELCIDTSNSWHAVRYRCYRNAFLPSAAAASAISFHRRRKTWHRDVGLFLALTEFSRSRFIESGLPEDHIIVKPNFVEDPGPRPFLPGQSNTILFVGRLSSEKGVEQLVDAWKDLRPEGLKLEIIGSGPSQLSLEGQLGPGIEMVGPLPRAEVGNRMLNARALVVPSIWYEGLSMSLLEALAAGLPVIASNLGSSPEALVAHGRDYLFDPLDRRSLTAALGRLRSDDFTNEGGRISRMRFEEKYSPARGIVNLETAYERALSPIQSGPGKSR
jgi:glycosyltransferase involved in cell wall biosynthesis